MTFKQAVRELPKCITGIDFVGQHKTIADLVASVQFQIDIYCEGEPERDIWTQKDLGRCRKYVEKFKEVEDKKS